MKLPTRIFVLIAALLAQGDQGEAAVYNLHLVTDKTARRYGRRRLHTRRPTSGRRRKRRRSPYGAGAIAAVAKPVAHEEDGRIIWDPILNYNSYGAMNCGVAPPR